MKPYYAEKNITIYHADWRDVLPSLEPRSINLLLTDPPYGTTNLEWDRPVDWKLFWPIVEQICRCYATMVLFSSGMFTITLINSNRKQFRYELIWEKPMPVGFLSANRRPLRAHENILVFAPSFKNAVYNPQMVKGKMHKIASPKGFTAHYGKHHRALPERVTNKWHPRSILRFSKPHGAHSLHPTQKPLDLMLWLIRTYSKPRQLILDSFCGSGSTLVAAKKTGRRAIGCDTDERSCEIAAQRLRNS
jgi:site-specific DNA-methyltransferase (adenine-specific)